MELPIKFLEDMKKLLGENLKAYMESYQEPRWYGLRVNTNKISVKDFLDISPFTLCPIPWIENGFYYNGELEKPGKHPFYFAGLYYLQEPSAMTPANHLPVKPGDKVLDLCAAPGGKTTELGAKLKGEGLLVSNDISHSRARILLKNQELMGLSEIYVMSENPKKMLPYFQEYFDKILIDAPCSGEGMFRKDTKMVKSWEEHGPEYYAVMQKELILQAAAMLKPGGMMLYSTCTFNQEENEGTISYLLDHHKEFSIVKQKEYEGFDAGIQGNYPYKELIDTVRIWPHNIKGEGHFLALLKKEDIDTVDETNHTRKKQKTKKKTTKLTKEVVEFFKNIHWDIDTSRLSQYEEKLYYLPQEEKNMNGLRLLRNGLFLGEIKKERFEPSQGLAMALKKEEYNDCIDLEVKDLRIMKYLKGETIDVEDLTSNKEKGWYLVCVSEYPLGWAKLANQSLKNKYAVGWRVQS